jgi:hypothetical protein
MLTCLGCCAQRPFTTPRRDTVELGKTQLRKTGKLEARYDSSGPTITKNKKPRVKVGRPVPMLKSAAANKAYAMIHALKGRRRQVLPGTVVHAGQIQHCIITMFSGGTHGARLPWHVSGLWCFKCPRP